MKHMFEKLEGRRVRVRLNYVRFTTATGVLRRHGHHWFLQGANVAHDRFPVTPDGVLQIDQEHGCDSTLSFGNTFVMCELPHGHPGQHSNEMARWNTAAEAAVTATLTEILTAGGIDETVACYEAERELRRVRSLAEAEGKDRLPRLLELELLAAHGRCELGLDGCETVPTSVVDAVRGRHPLDETSLRVACAACKERHPLTAPRTKETPWAG